MISATGVKRYCESVYAAKPIYLWGADLQALTQGLLDKLKSKFGASHYKDVDLNTQEGKLGADCSGLLTPISGTDTTAAGYYKNCADKGPAKSLPDDKTCLLFREENKNIVHVAIYVGDGTLYEMWSGCEHRSFVASQWTYYGIPEWIRQEPKDEIILEEPTYVYMSSGDALSGSGAVATYLPGKYYVYKRANGCANITKTKGKPGAWIVED